MNGWVEYKKVCTLTENFFSFYFFNKRETKNKQKMSHLQVKGAEKRGHRQNNILSIPCLDFGILKLFYKVEIPKMATSQN